MKKISVLLCFVVLIAACKKYPDGPKLTFRTPLQRIQGSWKVSEYLVDDVDSVSVFSQFATGMEIGFGATQDDNGFQGHIRCVEDTSQPYFYTTNYWELVNKKDDLQITNKKITNQIGITGPFADPDQQTYSIRRLTKDDLWLTIDYDGSNYQIHCIKI